MAPRTLTQPDPPAGARRAGGLRCSPSAWSSSARAAAARTPAPASDTTTQPKAGKKQATTPKPAPKPATYTVKTGDNLGSIAEKTKVPIETLQELNPELDPQALVTGQKIKLKE